jgi:hypothetical protein
MARRIVTKDGRSLFVDLTVGDLRALLKEFDDRMPVRVLSYMGDSDGYAEHEIDDVHGLYITNDKSGDGKPAVALEVRRPDNWGDTSDAIQGFGKEIGAVVFNLDQRN